MSKKIVSLLLALLMMLSMSAALAEASVTVTDMFDREITIKGPISRVVVMEPAECEILCALGGEALLVGRGAYCDYPASVMALPFLYAGDPALRALVESAQQPSQPDFSAPAMEDTGPTQTPAPSLPEPEKDGPILDFPQPWVDTSWFDNTLFIGDSRVEGLKLFARSGKADYFCDVGLQVYSVLEKELEDVGFPKQPLETLLSGKTYDKIFICFGLNEAGYPIGSFQSRYQLLLEKVRALQPEAAIILHGILSVTEEKSDSAAYLSLENLNRRNEVIASFADGERIFYVDANPWFADREGYLFPQLTNDGYHPTVEGYRHWRNWLFYMAAQLGI